ncbi:MAG TPA: polymer-forming cytoskeletal protein [Myxococcaceae bacterium]|nr:polymer-forming cytoskeletal protein [Myxococcaceae bacterium]
MAAKDLVASGNTVIGPSILINGKLTGDEDLTVRGRVEGELSLTKTLIVEPSGVVKANVTVKNAVVSGVVVGNIQATESVELTQEGRMVGDIRAPRVIIVDGASFRGRVDMGELPPGRSLPERSTPRTQVRPTVRGLPPPPPRPAAATAARPGNAGAAVPAKKPGGMPGIVRGETARPTPPAPPAPPVVAAGAKKKVVLKKKK